MSLTSQTLCIFLTRRFAAVALSVLLSASTGGLVVPQQAQAFSVDTGKNAARVDIADCTDSGMLVALAGNTQKDLGKCPLKHTDVKANVSGYVARVTVRQQFHNPFKEKIEAVYTFPLPDDASVDQMTMKVGNRLINGSIKKRDEARHAYEAARSRGNVASLLDQERPNIFTQSVANIEPGENIDIEITYVNLLKYEDGSFSFIFPTVVGPRFIPGHTSEGQTGVGVAQNTDLVPDASKITPPLAAPGERAGHDISIEMNINAGVPIENVISKLHAVNIERTGSNSARIKLTNNEKIPNKDFIASWSVAHDSVKSGYLTHRQGADGFFSLMLVPPKRVTAKTVQAKEMIFLIDCSGSQSGIPIQKAKETMAYILDHMNANDTFQIITFNNNVESFPARPQTASAAMKEKALDFMRGLEARGGTWMQPAVEEACALPNDEHRLRIMTFMTDGFVGNDFQIISLIKKHRDKTRWFSFGTGNSVNRFLIDKIAAEGGGEADYVLLNSSAEEVGKKFYDRISSPVLTDLKVEFKGVETKDVFPKEPADLWAQRPLYFTGRFLKPGSGKVILSGYSAGKPYRQELNLEFPAKQDTNEALPSIWARAKVERLMSEDWLGMQTGSINKELKDEITDTALKYHIMSQYTSFVAVEEESKTSGGKAKLVPVKVETAQSTEMAEQHPITIQPSWTRSAGGAGYAGGGGPFPNSNKLPAVNMGNFVHQAGDNQGAPATSAASQADCDYGPYMSDLQRRIKRAWFPPRGQETKRVSVMFKVHKDGSIGELRIDHSSGVNIADEAALLAASNAAPFRPLPASSPESVDIQFTFDYNVFAGDGPGTKPALKLVNVKDAGNVKEASNSAKFDKDLQLLLAEIARGQNPNKNVKDRVLIRVELTSSPDAALIAKLKKLGLELIKENTKFVVGRIEPKNLHELAKLNVVIHISLD